MLGNSAWKAISFFKIKYNTIHTTSYTKLIVFNCYKYLHNTESQIIVTESQIIVNSLLFIRYLHNNNNCKRKGRQKN